MQTISFQAPTPKDLAAALAATTGEGTAGDGAPPPEGDAPPERRPEIEADLGFGSIVARESRARLLNRDGTFNVLREGLGPLERLAPYHALLVMSWPRFLGYVTLFYLVINVLFALAYLACGPAALVDPGGTLPGPAIVRAFFFSVETFATIGYGAISPAGIAANLIMTAESLAGILAVALVTGLVFARFSRPTARVRFSRSALVAPYAAGGEAFMFRLANERHAELVQVEVRVLFSHSAVTPDGQRTRRFVELALERQRVAFLPLAWTVVHPIDEESPLRGLSAGALEARDAEFLVLLSGTDDASHQVVHARTSYKPSEVTWRARFGGMFNPPRPDGKLSIDVGRLDAIEPVHG